MLCPDFAITLWQRDSQHIRKLSFIRPLIHGFNEGFAFIYGLRFAYDAKIDAAKSDELMNLLTGSANGFYDLTLDQIDEVRDFIATAFGIDKDTEIGG